MKLIKNAYYLLIMLVSIWFGCQPNPAPPPDKTPPAEPKFTTTINTADQRNTILVSWASHVDFGLSGPAKVAYKLEISTDGQNFAAISTPTAPYSTSLYNLMNPKDQVKGYISSEIPSTVKEAVVTGLKYMSNYYFRLTAYNGKGFSKSYTSPTPLNIANYDVPKTAAYQEEQTGAPSRPAFISSFLFYPQNSFLHSGRYILPWVKRGDIAGPLFDYNPATSMELYRITFKNPVAMESDSKFGKNIDLADVKAIELLSDQTPSALQPEDRYVALPTNLLPAIPGNSDASTSYPALEIGVSKNSQYGYFGVNGTSSDQVVAYKVRAVRAGSALNKSAVGYIKDYYNDSKILFVNNKNGKWALVP